MRPARPPSRRGARYQKFECNYGSPFTGFIDQWCGSFREVIVEEGKQSKEYKGEYEADEASRKIAKDVLYDGATSAGVWSEMSYLGQPSSPRGTTVCTRRSVHGLPDGFGVVGGDRIEVRPS